VLFSTSLHVQPNTSWQRTGHAQLRSNVVAIGQRDVSASTDPPQRGRPLHDNPLGCDSSKENLFKFLRSDRVVEHDADDHHDASTQNAKLDHAMLHT